MRRKPAAQDIAILARAVASPPYLPHHLQVSEEASDFTVFYNTSRSLRRNVSVRRARWSFAVSLAETRIREIARLCRRRPPHRPRKCSRGPRLGCIFADKASNLGPHRWIGFEHGENLQIGGIDISSVFLHRPRRVNAFFAKSANKVRLGQLF